MPGPPGSATGGRRGYRVLMIAPTSFFADTGCHVRILEEARALQAMGNRVAVCAYRNGDDVEGIDIHRTLGIPWRRDYEVGSSRHKVAFDALLALKAAQAAIWERPEVIHAHLHEGALIGSVVGRLLGIPVVFDFQGSLTGEMVDHGFLDPAGRLYGPMRRLEEAIGRMPQAIIVSSQHARRLLAGDFGCRPERIAIVPDCVNSDSFNPSLREESGEELRRGLGIPPGRRIIVYLGLLAEYQGIGLLLDAMRRLAERRPDAHLLLMGWPGVDEYSQRARELGLADRVTLTGRLPYAQAPRHLALGEAAVSPKVSLTEGSGKLLNYMAMGLPTVAFDGPVSREYLGDLGIYAPLGDRQGLADALERALDDPDGARELGRGLRARAVERYSWSWAGERIVDVYDEVTGRGR